MESIITDKKESDQLTPEERAKNVEDDEDEQFDAMVKAFQAQSKDYDIDDDIEFFQNHPLHCKDLTPEMLEKPEFQALQNLAYDGTPEEVCRNFKNHAMEALNEVLLRTIKDPKVDQTSAERAMHFFNEAFKQDYKEYQMQFTLYMGRAKLNLLIAQFGRCKEDALEALKIKDDDEGMWLVLSRSRLFVEKFEDGYKYVMQGLQKCPGSEKLENMRSIFIAHLDAEKIIIKEINTIQAVKEEKKLGIYRDIRDKKIKIGKKIHDLPEGDVNLQITLDKQGKLHFPVLLLYDEFMTTDFIQDWTEDQTLRQALTPVFATQPPWDTEGDYTMQSLEVYYEADQTKPLAKKDRPEKKSTKKYVKLDLKMTLLEALVLPNHIIPHYPVLKVISSDSDFKDAFLNEI